MAEESGSCTCLHLTYFTFLTDENSELEEESADSEEEQEVKNVEFREDNIHDYYAIEEEVGR